MPRASTPRLAIRPLTPERWRDFTRLFGPNGACAGCWCQWPRLARAEFERGKGAPHRRRTKRLVDAGAEPGVLAYRGTEAVGWCAVAPRAEYRRLERSRILKPVDDAPVWSIVCLFVAREHRGAGVSVALIRGAAAHARRKGARIVEAYPLEPAARVPAAFAWYGLAAAYRAAGFTEVARRSATRPIVRLALR